MNPRDPSDSIKHFQWIITTLLVIALTVIGYQANQISSLQAQVSRISEKLASMDGNRFTSGDGLIIWQKIAEVQQGVARQGDKLEAAWREIDKIEKRLEGKS